MKTVAKAALPGVMAFYHEDGHVPAWNQAKEFAGPGGRIATLIDIIDMRLATNPGDTPWEQWYTSNSAEYVGYTKGGNKVILVTHGIGPMSTIDGILKAYSHEYKDKSRHSRGGRITQEEFWDLESGKYGKVSVVDFEKWRKLYENRKTRCLRLSEALGDPLLQVRLGDRLELYLQHHAAGARTWHLERAGIGPDGRDTSMGTGNSRLHREAGAPGSDPFIISPEDAANCSYAYTKVEQSEVLGHLLSIGRLAQLQMHPLECLYCDLSAHEWWNGVKFLGIREGAGLGEVHGGFGFPSALIFEHWQMLLEPADGRPVPAMPILIQGKDGQWFTQHAKKGTRMDLGIPEFVVRTLEPVGKPQTFQTTVGGYHGFVKYDRKEVAAVAPDGANCYAIIGEWGTVWDGGNPTHHTCSVQFYRADIDETFYLPSPDQIKNDYDLLMSLTFSEE